jgi:hypothetical protein
MEVGRKGRAEAKFSCEAVPKRPKSAKIALQERERPRARLAKKGR